ncbi:MAG TPA: histidine kinase, partial [Anaerolineaceae bacterium]|nr:histidine kinase [Anaerolineaceae bacterium]
HHFTQEEIDLVMTIANAGALAVENARYHETQMQLGIAQERNLLAQELHDRIAQSLAVVKLNLNSALLVMNKPDVIEKVNQSKQLVDDVYQDVRDAILGLRCLPKSVSGSMEEMRDYLATYGAHHAIDIQFLADERDFQVLDCEAVLQVGRIIDEAVVNGCKHASAEHIWVNSGLSENLFWLTIEDDGVGIDWEKLKLMQGDHFGMQIMRERAITAGGHLTITDRPAGGTCVTFEKLVREAN